MATITRQDSVAAIRLINAPAAGDMVELTGYYNPGDGGGGEFYWDAASTATDNGGTIIKSVPANGRWFRVFQQPVNVQWFGAKGDGSTDDTTNINNTITAAGAGGEVVFQPNLTYVISGTLTLSNAITIDLSGATLQFAGSVSGTNVAAFTVSHDNVTIKNGTINGTYNPATDVPTPGVGPYGINNNGSKANLVVDRLTISNVQSYGIIAASGVSPRITNCRFINTGYISLFSSSTTGTIDGGLVEGNIFDRSGINTANIIQPCVSIRGDNSAGLIYTSDWVITNNRFMTAVSPSSTTAACMEVRYMLDSTISNNVFVNGSLGLSIVGSANITASANTMFGCSNYGLELAGCNYCTADSNIINGNSVTGSIGITLDGSYPTASEYNTLSNNNVTGTAATGIQVFKGAANNTIIGGTIVQTNSGQSCINIIGAQSTLITGVLMYGQSTGSTGIVLDNSQIGSNAAYIINGTIINGCRFDSLASQAINIYAPSGGTISGLRFTNNFATGTMLNSTLTGGATLSAPYYYNNSPEIIGSKVILATGTNASAGTATLAAGTVTVTNTLVTANSLIMLSVVTRGGATGTLAYTKTAGTSFTITSASATDTSTVAWVMIN